jgi:hypothetical protein
MEDRETPWMRKYGERKTTQIMMATVPHITAWAGCIKYHANGFLLDWVYTNVCVLYNIVHIYSTDPYVH